jgi:hypothetical protein
LVRRDVVVLACAVSAGIHGALAPAHFAEGVGAGGGFVAAVVLLTVVAVALTRRPSDAWIAAGAAVFAGLIASYAAAVTTGLPLLHPEPEAIDGLALATKAVEAAGLVVASSLLTHRLRPERTPTWTRHAPHARFRSS